MITVYFDRNVFADICELRRGLSERDIAIIEQAVASQEIIIPASITLIEETIPVLKESEDKYSRHITTVFGLIQKETMVKPFYELIVDDCYSYAQSSPYQRTMEAPSNLKDILDLSKNRADMIAMAEDITQSHKASAANITESLLAARVAGEEKNIGTPDDFNQLWEGLSITMIENFLEQVPRNIRRLCKKRGLKNMLKIKSIRLYTIYYAWLVHSGWFGIEGAPRKMKEGDVGDFFHAVQASVASIFVTQESKDRRDKLPSILSQVPTKGFTIMSLEEFIEFLQQKIGQTLAEA